MRKLLLLLLLTGCAAAQPTKPDAIAVFRDEIRAEAAKKGVDPDKWVIKDLGETVDLGEGEGPVAEVYRRDLAHTCIVAISPDGHRAAVLECRPRVPELDG